MVITAILMGVIMALTDDGNGIPRGPLAPLLIGLLIAVIGASMGPLTGFAMNPARDIGPKPSPLQAGATSPSPVAKIFLTSWYRCLGQLSGLRWVRLAIAN
jgi:glycerol uptake facilitator-like aquaporin